MIPLALRIRKEAHRQIAKAQDIIVETLYEVFDYAVFHGGTCIWRCYQGNRFSEDIDVYLKRDVEKINEFFKNLEKKGFEILKKKIGENSIYSSLRFDRIEVRFEALFKNVKGELRDYESIESNKILVYALSPESLISEKVSTYLKRRKIRDLYDIFFLSKKVSNTKDIKPELVRLMKDYKEPIDESDLQVIILEGLVPKSNDIIKHIKNIAA